MWRPFRIGILRQWFLGEVFPSPQRTCQATSGDVDLRRNVQAQQVEHCWKQIDSSRGHRQALTGNHAGPTKEEWHGESRLVEEETVKGFPVVSQAFAVIRCHDEERVVP